MSVRGSLTLLGVTCLLLVFGTLVGFGKQTPLSPRPPQHEEPAGPPTDPRYQAAIAVGVGGNYRAARAELSALARERQGTSTGAWALYQAALAARAQKDQPGFRALAAELQREYPGHRLSMATGLQERRDSPPRKRGLPDCGPRSLVHLCAEAGIVTERETVSRLCGTDRHGTTLEGLRQAAERLGMRAAPAQVDAAFLRRHRPAGIAWVAGDHFVAFIPDTTRGGFSVFDPNVGERRAAAADELMRKCSGIVLLTAWGERKLPPLERVKDEG